MPSIDDIVIGVLRREGGFVNDPSDPGGPTNFGVTLGTLRGLGLDINGDGAVDIADVRVLTRAEAVDIYKKQYFEKPGIGALPAPIQASVFDMYVNAGGRAISILQKLVADFGFPVDVDGVSGPQTAAAAGAAFRAAPDHLVDAYGIARRNYYYELADRRPDSRKYAKRKDGGKGGWITRAEEFISRRFHLSNDQHRARVAAWA